MFIIRATLAVIRWLLGIEQEKPLQVIDNAKLIHLIKLSAKSGDGVRCMHGDPHRDSALFSTQGQTT